MYAYLKGELAEVAEDQCVIEVNQIGYYVKISTGVAGMLPRIGTSIKIFTYTCVKEDSFTLYGFLTKDDYEIFKKLITVNGIGPKGAMSILSVMTPDALRFAIMAKDIKAIAKAPGIGTKTAERLIIDLKDKITVELDTMLGAESSEQEGQTVRSNQPSKNEAIEALISLGYSSTDAYKAVSKVAISEEMQAEAVLKLALKQISNL